MKIFNFKITWLQIVIFSLVASLVIIIVFKISDKKTNMKNDTEIKADVVMFGDSITHLNDWTNIFPKQIVINSGHSGFTTRQLLRMVDKKVIKYQPEYCYVMMGINDLLQGKQVHKITKNYQLIVEKLLDNNVKVVIQSTLYTQYRPEINNSVDLINHFLKGYCDQSGLMFLDLNEKLCADGFLPKKYSTDGLHLNHEAYRVWGDLIMNNYIW